MHGAAHKFVESIVAKFPLSFKGVRAVEFGSRYINGSVRDCFYQSTFVGIDAYEGENVDIVGLTHEFKADKPFDVAFSTEMLEHDPHWPESLRAMVHCLRPGGLFFMTCATTGRKEHGTNRQADPDLYTPDPSYYRNITEEDLKATFKPDWFSEWGSEVNHKSHDLYAWGVRA